MGLGTNQIPHQHDSGRGSGAITWTTARGRAATEQSTSCPRPGKGHVPEHSCIRALQRWHLELWTCSASLLLIAVLSASLNVQRVPATPNARKNGRSILGCSLRIGTDAAHWSA